MNERVLPAQTVVHLYPRPEIPSVDWIRPGNRAPLRLCGILEQKVETMVDEASHFVSIHRLSNRFEADLLMNALEQEGIPAILRSFEETPYNGLFIAQRGYGLIMVPDEAASRAREILKPILAEIEACERDDARIADPILWQRLREADPEDVCRYSLVRLNDERDRFIVPFLNTEFLCCPETEQIVSFSTAPFHRADLQLHLVLLHYLLEAVDQPVTNRWIGAKDIPGGEAFFRGVHNFRVEPLAGLLAFRPEAFEAAAVSLGGRRVQWGDLAWRLQVLPRIPMLLVVHLGDEEFETAIHVLFDETIFFHLKKLDVIWAMVNVFVKTFLCAGKCLTGGQDQ